MTGVKNIWLGLLVLGLASKANADIVGGVDVTPKDPVRASTAALFTPSGDGRSGALCTASVISPNTAVTAAHCIDPRGAKPVIIFGANAGSPESVKRPVSKIAVHPQWAKHQGRGMDQGDIAVVKFPGGLPEGVHPVPMAGSETSLKKGRIVTLAGYGISDARTRSGSGKLRKTSVKVDNARPGKSEMILDQSHGHGACHGDSGGPAYIKMGGKPVLAGVTNRSYPATAPDDCGHKVVYTKVSAYQKWIEKKEAQFQSSGGGTVQDEGTLRGKTRLQKVKHKRSKHSRTVKNAAYRKKKVTHFKPVLRRNSTGHVTRTSHRKKSKRSVAHRSSRRRTQKSPTNRS